MAGDHVHEFTDTNFETEVLKAETPVLVDFWAEWCMPCRMLSDIIDDVANDFQGKVKVGKVDTESNRKIAMQYGISAIPTVIIFSGGEIKRKFVGLTSKEELAAAMDAAAKN